MNTRLLYLVAAVIFIFSFLVVYRSSDPIFPVVYDEENLSNVRQIIFQSSFYGPGFYVLDKQLQDVNVFFLTNGELLPSYTYVASNYYTYLTDGSIGTYYILHYYDGYVLLYRSVAGGIEVLFYDVNTGEFFSYLIPGRINYNMYSGTVYGDYIFFGATRLTSGGVEGKTVYFNTETHEIDVLDGYSVFSAFEKNGEIYVLASKGYKIYFMRLSDKNIVASADGKFGLYSVYPGFYGIRVFYDTGVLFLDVYSTYYSGTVTAYYADYNDMTVRKLFTLSGSNYARLSSAAIVDYQKDGKVYFVLGYYNGRSDVYIIDVNAGQYTKIGSYSLRGYVVPVDIFDDPNSPYDLTLYRFYDDKIYLYFFDGRTLKQLGYKQLPRPSGWYTVRTVGSDYFVIYMDRSNRIVYVDMVALTFDGKTVVCRPSDSPVYAATYTGTVSSPSDLCPSTTYYPAIVSVSDANVPHLGTVSIDYTVDANDTNVVFTFTVSPTPSYCRISDASKTTELNPVTSPFSVSYPFEQNHVYELNVYCDAFGYSPSSIAVTFSTLPPTTTEQNIYVMQPEEEDFSYVILIRRGVGTLSVVDIVTSIPVALILLLIIIFYFALRRH